MNKADLARRGAMKVVAAIGVMAGAIVVAFLGAAVAPSPELVNHAAENSMLALIVVGIIVDADGLIDLQDAAR